MPGREQCGKCLCWDVSTEGLNKDKIGDCRRHPPLIQPLLLKRGINLHAVQADGAEGLEVAIYEGSAFPMTHREGWCADFMWKPGEEPIIC